MKLWMLLVDILNHAVEADLLIKNPTIGINPIIDGKVKSEKRILSREEMEIPKTLQKILGHNPLQMTMDLYFHVRESTLTDEMERIANFI